MGQAAVAIGVLVQLITLAEEAAGAAAKISAMLKENENKPITDAQWATLLGDRAIAQTLLAAAIARSQVDAIANP